MQDVISKVTCCDASSKISHGYGLPTGAEASAGGAACGDGGRYYYLPGARVKIRPDKP